MPRTAGGTRRLIADVSDHEEGDISYEPGHAEKFVQANLFFFFSKNSGYLCGFIAKLFFYVKRIFTLLNTLPLKHK